MAAAKAPSPTRAGVTPLRDVIADATLPAFKPLRELATITDDDELRRQMLARLDDIYDRAIRRERTVGKDQNVVLDPDSHSACKVVEIASDILGVKVGKRGGGGAFDPSVFQPAKVEAS
jgi:hypothetical protein